MSRNELVLSGTIAAKETLRYTPAGLPLLQLVLSHQSEQSEAGAAFRAELEAVVLVLGEAATALDRQPLGTRISIKGFLARKSRNSRQLVIRTEQFKLFDGE
ncbi:MAG: primosomal replication protein N [Betaproteobacteria bacterium]|nr:primosomal replication protein N [Betaproteobacteria bacterium]MDE2623549.1 primosomal replication protein N [Betaproteobacteria bacterium]